MTKRRVVVTGLGTVNPMGLDVATTWQAVCQGKSGIGPVTHFDASSYSTRIVGAVKNFDITMVAAEQAMQDAGFPDDIDFNRFGVAVGSGIGGLNTIEQNYQQLVKSGPRRVSPFLVPAAVINMASGNIAIRHGLKGPNFAITTACTTGTHNIGYAARTIAYGDADLTLAGGTEGLSSPLGRIVMVLS